MKNLKVYDKYNKMDKEFDTKKEKNKHIPIIPIILSIIILILLIIPSVKEIFFTEHVDIADAFSTAVCSIILNAGIAMLCIIWLIYFIVLLFLKKKQKK